MPKDKMEGIEQKEEIFGLLKQSRISAKNMKRLRVLASASDQDVAKLATIVLEIAKVKPHKKRRLKVLSRERRDLLDALEKTGLIFAHHW